jgi:hypothetical protein
MLTDDSIVIDRSSPEKGWPPFIDWLRDACKVIPSDVVRVEASPRPNGMVFVTITRFAFDSAGNRPQLTTLSPDMPTYTISGLAALMPPLNR